MRFKLPTLPRFLNPPAARPSLRRNVKRWPRGPMRRDLLRLTVERIVEETPSTKTFVFADHQLAYRPGQHVTIVADIGGQTHRRCYSFSSSPVTGAKPSITVKRVDGGVLSNWLHEQVRAGDVLTALPPSGGFVVDADPAVSRSIAMVAGGVGITPLISMAETVLRTEPLSRVTLLYGSRSESEIIFHRRLDALVHLFGARFQVILALDELPPVWKGLSGALDGEAVSRAIELHAPEAWYLCGPAAMMDSVNGKLRGAGIDAARIHLERFQYAESGNVETSLLKGAVFFAKTGVTTPPLTGTTILEAAEQAGVLLPSSCRMGGCGACKVKVEGSVVHAEPNCLTDAERAEGYALACCSYADGRVAVPGY